MTGVVRKAAEVAPSAFQPATAQDPLGRPDDLVYDLRHMTAFDNHPVDLERFKADAEGYLKDVTDFAVKGLVARLFALPTESTSVGPVAELPPAYTVLPRAKPIPAPKKETRWEKFAKEKGIDGRKRSRMVWDEQQQAYKPRWGYDRANNGIEDVPIIEIKPGDDPFADPWTEARQNKKARVAKNLGQQRRNKEEADPSRALFGLPVDLTSTKKHEGGPKAKGKKGKAGGLKALEVAQHSTASIGRFDKKLEGEPEKKVAKVKKVAPSVEPKALLDEGKRMRDIMQSVIRPKAAGGKAKHVNIDSLEPASAGYRRKKGRGADKSGKKKRKG